jgi:hypothetical protein
MNELQAEIIENDLYIRLAKVSDTGHGLFINDIVNAFSEWLSDNGLAIVNDDAEIIEI